MAGRDPGTGANRHPPLELVRLAVPRRVYTSRQLEHAADATRSVLAEADAVRGLRITYEAPVLRHFTRASSTSERGRTLGTIARATRAHSRNSIESGG